MEHFPALWTRAESDALVERVEARFAEHGWGFWALEVPGTRELVGFTGLQRVTLDNHLNGTVEVA